MHQCGGQASNQEAALVAIHDSARPLVKAEDVKRCLEDALEVRPLPAPMWLIT